MATGIVNTDRVNLRADPEVAAASVAILAKDATVDIISERRVDNTSWLLVASVIGGQTHVGWIQGNFVNLGQAGSSSFDWARTPQVGSKGFHDKFGGQKWKFDGRGVIVEDEDEQIRRTGGAPSTCTKILALYGKDIFNASVKHGIPPELIVMTIATETAAFKRSNFTGPPTFRWERAISTYSAGPMQTLATTAHDVIRKLGLPYDPERVAQTFTAEPSVPPAALGLYDAAASIDIGTGFVALCMRNHNTGFDPILVAACYNAGSLRDGSNNPWHLRSFGDHLNRASEWFGDACTVLSVLRAGGSLDPTIVRSNESVTTSDANTFEISGLLPAEADEEAAFYTDGGARVTRTTIPDGLVTIRVSFDADQAGPRPVPPSDTQPPTQQGYVLCIDRIRSERRRGKGFDRTVGRYQAFFNGQKLPDIFGMVAERQGPSDNGTTGVREHRRIEAGTYPLFTHAGSRNRFLTIGFSPGNSIGSIPYPAVKVADTNKRGGILIHCGSGYLWSTGCLNLSSGIDDADDNIDFSDSRKRVIALINSMKECFPGNFPRSPNREIPGAVIVIRDPP